MGLSFAFSEELIHFLLTPLPDKELVLFSPLEGFEIAFWTSLIFGALFSLPFWIVPCLSFIFPAFTEQEKKGLYPLMGLSIFCLGLGGVVAYSFSIPFMTQALFDFNESYGKNLWGVKSTIDFMLGIYLAHAVLFEAGLVLFFLVHGGLIKYRTLKQKRKAVYLIILIVAAILTPPDVASQLLLAVPMIALYEIALGYSYLKRV